MVPLSDSEGNRMEKIELETISKHPTLPLWEVEPGSIHLGFRYSIEGKRVWSACRLRNNGNREFASTKWGWYPDTDTYECIYLL
jgi:hypothetical protein